MNNLKNDLLGAAKSHFTAKRDLAKSNLNVYLSNPAGIGEHGDIMEVVIDLVAQITESSDNIKMVESLMGNQNGQTYLVESYKEEKRKLFNETNPITTDITKQVVNPGESGALLPCEMEVEEERFNKELERTKEKTPTSDDHLAKDVEGWEPPDVGQSGDFEVRDEVVRNHTMSRSGEIT